MTSELRVCPSCGEPAGATAFCAACGQNIAHLNYLPTRSEWEDTRGTEPTPETAHAAFDRGAASVDGNFATPPAGRGLKIAVVTTVLICVLLGIVFALSSGDEDTDLAYVEARFKSEDVQLGYGRCGRRGDFVFRCVTRTLGDCEKDEVFRVYYDSRTGEYSSDMVSIVDNDEKCEL